jgi:hypothetical protein
MPKHSTPVEGVTPAAITLRIDGTFSLRRPRETPGHPVRRTGRDFPQFTGNSLRAVTNSHRMTSPVPGAVALAVMELTCCPISIPGQQGGEKPMSLAPEAR